MSKSGGVMRLTMNGENALCFLKDNMGNEVPLRVRGIESSCNVYGEIDVKVNAFYDRDLEEKMKSGNTFKISQSRMWGRELHKTQVIYNPPATIVLWADGTRTVVKCSPKDIYDPEKGLALCYMKKALGNTSRALNDVLHSEEENWE